jgi:hypothetical protein
MEFMLVVVVLLTLVMAAVRWGANSTEGIHSLKWNRRQERGGIF